MPSPGFPGRVLEKDLTDSRKITTANQANDITRFAGFQKVIDFLNVVDDFKIKEHPNFLPRWAFLVIVLSVLALT